MLFSGVVVVFVRALNALKCSHFVLQLALYTHSSAVALVIYFFYGFSVATIHVAHAYSLCIYFFLNLLLALLNEFLRPTHKHTRARATQRQRVNHGFYEIFQPHRRTSYTFNVFFWTQERNMNIINLPSLYVKRNRCHVC